MNNDMVNTFLLGISVGGGCIAHCGSVLLPMLLCEKRKRWTLAGLFLVARLFGYIVFALVSYGIGSRLDSLHWNRFLLEGIVFVVMGALLLRYAWSLRNDINCASSCGTGDGAEAFKRFKYNARNYALQAGFATGISLCTPFLLVVMEGATSTGPLASVLAFLSFYLGTTVLLLPVLLGGVLSRGAVVRQIGYLCGFLCGGVYIIQGCVVLVEGIYEKL